MAASTVNTVRTTLKGMYLFSGRWVLRQSSQSRAVCPSLRLHVSPAVCSRMETQRSEQTQNTDRGRAQEEVEEPEGPEYIPKRKAKNPMVKIGFAWIIGLPTGIISFFLAKRQVDKNRLKQLKIRQRMKRSNEGEYEGSRYRHHAVDVKLDQ
uniref:Si:ch73-71c20.5 n=1 Tax=Maylandia zebra TaxID=106582 RepID=A0A3P9DLA2_9CICH